jgi:hypothetical protein
MMQRKGYARMIFNPKELTKPPKHKEIERRENGEEKCTIIQATIQIGSSVIRTICNEALTCNREGQGEKKMQ